MFLEKDDCFILANLRKSFRSERNFCGIQYTACPDLGKTIKTFLDFIFIKDSKFESLYIREGVGSGNIYRFVVKPISTA
jgi:hypothetical protein